MRPGLSVLGTPVFEAADDDRQAAFVLSDLHVPEGGGAVVEALRAVLAAAAAAGRNARLLLLGDLFDSYFGPAQLRVGIWREVAAMLKATAAAGVSVTVLHGNRDFLLGSEFERATGARVLPGGVRCRLGGKATLFLHGDELCVNDLPYQRAKRWLRHPATKLAVRSLPLWLGLKVTARARRKSRQVMARGDQARFLPTRAAIEQALRTAGVERLVFGHIHTLAHGTVTGGEYWVLPAFDERPMVLEDGARFGFRAVSAGGLQAVEEPGPLPHPA